MRLVENEVNIHDEINRFCDAIKSLTMMKCVNLEKGVEEQIVRGIDSDIGSFSKALRVIVYNQYEATIKGKTKEFKKMMHEKMIGVFKEAINYLGELFKND